MALPQNILIKISYLMCKIILSNGIRRRRLQHRHRQWRQERLLRLHKMRRIYSRLSQERMLYMKMLTAWVQANSFRRRTERRPSLWFEKTVKEKFTDNQWQKYFRMSKKTFFDLTDKINSRLCSMDSDTSVQPDKKVAVALLSLASGKRNSTIAYQFGIHRSKVADIIKNVCEAIVKVLMPQYIKAPRGEVLAQYLEGFERKWGFPQCAGVLGSIHVPLHTTELPENAADYVDSDGGHSMFLQGVVDPSYKFWDINIGWPGSVTESRVFTSSALWIKGQDGTLFPDWTKRMDATDVPIFILAGSSYPLSEWVLKPFQRTDTFPKDELKFNEKFAFAHNASEIAFKRLKARWNCLVIGNICSIDIFPNVAAACCVLHNICECAREYISDEWIVKAENYYRQPLPSACNSIIGNQAEWVQQAVKYYLQD